MPFLKLEELNNTGTIESIMTYPLTGDFYFWAKILFGLFLIITFSLFFEEKKRLGKANFLSASAVGGFATIVLAFIGSLFGIVTSQIFTGALVIGAIIIFIWVVKKD